MTLNGSVLVSYPVSQPSPVAAVVLDAERAITQNGHNGVFEMQASVELGGRPRSVVTSMPPLVSCPYYSALCTFPVAPFDPDNGIAVFSLATPAMSGVPAA